MVGLYLYKIWSLKTCIHYTGLLNLNIILNQSHSLSINHSSIKSKGGVKYLARIWTIINK